MVVSNEQRSGTIANYYTLYSLILELDVNAINAGTRLLPVA